MVVKLFTYWRDDNCCNLGGSASLDLLIYTIKSTNKPISLYTNLFNYISMARKTDQFLGSIKYENGQRFKYQNVGHGDKARSGMSHEFSCRPIMQNSEAHKSTSCFVMSEVHFKLSVVSVRPLAQDTLRFRHFNRVWSALFHCRRCSHDLYRHLTSQQKVPKLYRHFLIGLLGALFYCRVLVAQILQYSLGFQSR